MPQEVSNRLQRPFPAQQDSGGGVPEILQRDLWKTRILQNPLEPLIDCASFQMMPVDIAEAPRIDPSTLLKHSGFVIDQSHFCDPPYGLYRSPRTANTPQVYSYKHLTKRSRRLTILLLIIIDMIFIDLLSFV